ncbi:hypothetical protein J2728_000826 [Caulobacter segnis]|nr:hypothetical protein [Caulobacter segnis]
MTLDGEHEFKAAQEGLKPGVSKSQVCNALASGG